MFAYSRFLPVYLFNIDIFIWFVFIFLFNTLVLKTQAALETKFDDLFGTSAAIDPFNFNSQNGMRKDDK